MARSVNYQSDAILVKFMHFEPVYGEFNLETGEYEGDNFNEFATQDSFDCLVCGLVDALKQRFPSLEDVPPFRECSGTDALLWSLSDRECTPILRNGNCAVFLAEYCGLISLSFCRISDFYDGDWRTSGLNEHWIRSAENGINEAIDSVTERLICCGRFSNGEALYSRAANL